MRRHLLFLPLLLLGLLLAPAPTRADDGPPEEAPAPSGATVGVITGERVNLRVAPRVDNHPVRDLPTGEVVLVLETRGDWLSVRVPSGFPAAVSTDYAVPQGPDVLRVDATKLNLRCYPPREGEPTPAAFIDRVEQGTLLPLIRFVDAPEGEVTGEGVSAIRSSGWAWIQAPEQVRAFVHSKFVKLLGPLSEHEERVEAARARRHAGLQRLVEVRREGRVRDAGSRLMEELGKVQQDLYRLRKTGGTDKAPIIALANRMDVALEHGAQAPQDVLRLARALREDLEREIQLRVARHDAELARTRGLDPPTVPRLEKVVEKVTVDGTLRYEPTPGWQEEGVFFLFVDGRPRFVLRVATGGPLPHPEFAKHVNVGPRRLIGRQPGQRLFGLPVLEVTHLTGVPAR